MRRHLLLPIALFLVAGCGEGLDGSITFAVPNTGSGEPATHPASDAGTIGGGSVDAGSGAAPATVASNGIFPPDSDWNTRIDDAPVDPRSDAYIASMGANGKLVASWDEEGHGLPYVEVPEGQMKVPVSFWGFPKESDPGPYPIPWNAPVQIGSDAHVLVVDRANGWLYELFQASRNSDGSWQASNGDERPSSPALDLGGCCRDAGLPWDRPPQRGGGRMDRPRPAVRGQPEPAWLRLAGEPRGRNL